MSDLATAKTIHVNLQQQDNVLSKKLVATETERNSQSQELNSAIANRDATEKRHIMDQASDAEVTASQQLCDTLEAKLAATNRRIDLIKTARSELASKIAAASQHLTIARRDHCLAIRDKKLEAIKNNLEFRDTLLSAMAAQASNGQVQYTTDPARFVQDFFRQILPEITPVELQTAVEKFARENSLD